MFPLLFFFLIWAHNLSPAAADLAGDGAALIAFRNAVGAKVLPWNAAISPCKWKGIQCNGGRVTAVRLPARGLIGQIPAGTLGNLAGLRILSLRHNGLFGPLPSDLTRCTQLQFLYLNQNHFIGETLTLISSITSLIRLNLANNNFSGEISSAINNLKQLNSLYLENNSFTGEIDPGFDIPKLKFFNVSFNRLNGSVPEKLRFMPASSFLGNFLCGGPLRVCPGKSRVLSGGAIAGIAIGAAVLFMLIVGVLFLLFHFKRENLIEICVEKPVEEGKIEKRGEFRKELVFLGNAPKVFDLEDLLRSTADVLGKGICGISYRTVIGEDLVVAVKRLKNVKISEKEFATKIKVLSAIKHANIVPIRAYYYSREEKLLVYDYFTLGSLSWLIHGNRGLNRSPLKWETRVKIALESARAIEFIHRTSSSSHGNIKSSNILITGSHQAQLSEHGLAHLVASSDRTLLTPEADVFCFGVLLLELVTGKAPARGKETTNLPQWVESLIRNEGTKDLFDEELVRCGSPEEEMVMVLQLGVDCASRKAEHRPSMSSVVGKMEEIQNWAARKKDKLKEKEDF